MTSSGCAVPAGSPSSTCATVAGRDRNCRSSTSVLLPRDHDQVRAILDLAGAKGWAVVPFGGGTSVVDGVDVTDRSDRGCGLLGDERRAAPGPGDRRGAGAGRHHRPGVGAVARGARVHLGPHPPVLGAGHSRRLRRDPLGRADLHRLRPGRCHRDETAGGHSARRLRVGPSAGNGCRSGPAGGVPRQRGVLRRDHRGGCPRAAAAGEAGCTRG